MAQFRHSWRIDASTLRSFCFLSAIMLWMGCRVPEPPIIQKTQTGIIYDTAMEDEIRSGKAPKLVLTAFARYVDTLSEPVAITEWNDDSCKWSVFVATNRGRFVSPNDPMADKLVLDEPSYGRCEVELPHRKRGVEPRTEPNEKTVGVASVSSSSKSASPAPLAKVEATALSETDFLDGITDQVSRSRQKDLLVFVHGFNVSFDAAVARTAQLAMDMPFNGAVVSYSWPSQGGVLNYSEDEPINAASVSPFTQFLKSLRTGIPRETRVHVVVHSMGNRIVMQACKQLSMSKDSHFGLKPLANVILCAPDVGHRDFMNWAPSVIEQSDRVTMYANDSDTALIASKSLHSELRAGDAWSPLVVKGIETIDCSRIDLTFMGHSYYGSNSDVLTDLFMLIKEGSPAANRPHLEKKRSDNGHYWQFAQSAGTVICTWHFDD